DVEEKSTGELQLSAGFSSLESFIVQASIRQRNFRGKGQELRASVNYSSYSKSIELGFTEPYLFDKNIALGGDIFRRDYNSFNLTASGDRNTTYTQVSTGFQVRAGVPLTEYLSLSARYGLTFDDVGLDESTYYSNGVCDPLKAGRYLCDAIGNRATSSVGYSLIYDSLNSRLRPTAGQRVVLSQDFAGLGGDVRYIRTKFDADKYWGLGSGFTLGLSTEGGYIHSLEKSRGAGVDKVRITDRFYLGEPEFRGFDIRGVGPRVQRIPFTTDASGKQILVTDRDQIVDDALGGRAYYSGRLELEIPLGAGARELGLRPSIYVQAGALFGLTRPEPTVVFPVAADGTVLPLPLRDTQGRDLFAYTNAAGQTATTICPAGVQDANGNCNGLTANTPLIAAQPFFERYVGDSAKPRVSVGAGVNWNSPFGPLRVDLAYALLKDKGDDDKLITFNVGTAF
ncbi:BamA/TamA family outer membrane protein, partial [Sphingomonas hylomeconis]